MTFKHILYASDFSKASGPAFKLAQDLAKAFKSELILFHAYQAVSPMMAEAPMPPAVFQDMLVTTRKHARRQLERLAKSAARRRVRTSILSVEGPPAPAIVRAARQKRAALIVQRFTDLSVLLGDPAPLTRAPGKRAPASSAGRVVSSEGV